GIRDFHVTGVQTCALPIYRFQAISCFRKRHNSHTTSTCTTYGTSIATSPNMYNIMNMSILKVPEKSNPSQGADLTGSGRGVVTRSEERRVGKECRSGWGRA